VNHWGRCRGGWGVRQTGEKKRGNYCKKSQWKVNSLTNTAGPADDTESALSVKPTSTKAKQNHGQTSNIMRKHTGAGKTGGKKEEEAGSPTLQPVSRATPKPKETRATRKTWTKASRQSRSYPDHKDSQTEERALGEGQGKKTTVRMRIIKIPTSLEAPIGR